eukprot:m.191166 g.191166  ORF g.191166 m.191166 type:complete len:655 (+) comp39441_c1_seq2:356-2320(+)
MKAFILALLFISTLSLAVKALKGDVTVNPTKQAVIRNESFIVKCNLASETTRPKWSHNGRPLNIAQFSITNHSSQDNSRHILAQSITKTGAVDADNGTYTCQVGQNNASASVLVTGKPEITILGPQHKDAYEDKDKTIQAQVKYQGGDIALNLDLIKNGTAVAVPGTAQHKEVYGKETFNITLPKVQKQQEGYRYVVVLRGMNLRRQNTKFYSLTFCLSIKRKPLTPVLSLLKKGSGYADIKLIEPDAELSHLYDTVNNFSVSFSTMWGQTGKKVLNAPVSEFRLNSLYPWTLYNVTVTAHGSETQSDPSFLNFSTTFDTDKPVGFFVIPKTREVFSNASGPIFPVCDEHQSFGNCTTAVQEIRNVSFTSPDWCYLLDFNRTASPEEWVLVSEGLSYFRVVPCNSCHRLKPCPVERAKDNKNWVWILVGVLVPLLLAVIARTVCYRKSQRQSYITSQINENEDVRNPSYFSTGEEDSATEAVSEDSTQTYQSAPTKKSTESGIDEDRTDASEVTPSEGRILTTQHQTNSDATGAVPSVPSASLENCQISYRPSTETSEEPQDKSRSDTTWAVSEKRSSATDDIHYDDKPITRRKDHQFESLCRATQNVFCIGEFQMETKQLRGVIDEFIQSVSDKLPDKLPDRRKTETSESHID